ncbi:osmosis-related lipoprotein [Burkholderia sp. 3C]
MNSKGNTNMNTKMKTTHFLIRATVIALVVSSLGACAVTRTQRNAGIGAAAGGALGYLITGGPIGTVAGAAGGALVGANVHR